MRFSRRQNWRTVSIGLTAALCLTMGPQGGALADTGNDDYKDNPAAISDTPLFPADDGPQATTGQEEAADRVTAILTNNGVDVPTKNGLPYQLARGVVGISGSPTRGYTVLVAKGVSTAKVTSSVFAGLSKGATAGLTLKTAGATVEEITAVWDAVSSRKWVAEPDAKISLGMSVEDGQVVVDLDERASDKSRANLAALSKLVRIVDIAPMRRSSRYSDDPPHYGGASISSSGATCTAGFTVKGKTTGTYYSVTAGHCGSNGDTFDSGSFYYGEMAGNSGFPEFDMARLKGSTYAGRLWTVGQDNFDTRVVTGANDGEVGTTVCQSGQTTSSVCGITIQKLDYKFCDTDGTCTPHTGRGTKSGDICHHGDSGAPVYVRNTSESRASIRGTLIACDTGWIVWQKYSTLSSHLNVVAVIP